LAISDSCRNPDGVDDDRLDRVRRYCAAIVENHEQPRLSDYRGAFDFCGAVAIAQFLCTCGLPDAMEGPTPISALIHAATMVAPVFTCWHASGFIIQASHTALEVSPGLEQSLPCWPRYSEQQADIKRILATRRFSQLGYMVMAIGLASNEAAMFHLFTHAFFKALLSSPPAPSSSCFS